MMSGKVGLYVGAVVTAFLSAFMLQMTRRFDATIVKFYCLIAHSQTPVPHSQSPLSPVGSHSSTPHSLAASVVVKCLPAEAAWVLYCLTAIYCLALIYPVFYRDQTGRSTFNVSQKMLFNFVVIRVGGEMGEIFGGIRGVYLCFCLAAHAFCLGKMKRDLRGFGLFEASCTAIGSVLSHLLESLPCITLLINLTTALVFGMTDSTSSESSTLTGRRASGCRTVSWAACFRNFKFSCRRLFYYLSSVFCIVLSAYTLLLTFRFKETVVVFLENILGVDFSEAGAITFLFVVVGFYCCGLFVPFFFWDTGAPVEMTLWENSAINVVMAQCGQDVGKFFGSVHGAVFIVLLAAHVLLLIKFFRTLRGFGLGEAIITAVLTILSHLVKRGMGILLNVVCLMLLFGFSELGLADDFPSELIRLDEAAYELVRLTDDPVEPDSPRSGDFAAVAAAA